MVGMIKAAIFDMDGLLIDSEPIWLKAHQKAYKPFGIKFTRAEHIMITGMRTEQAVETVHDRHPWSGKSIAEVGAEIEEEAVRLIKKEVSLKPGVHKVLRICKEAGLPVSIASSSKSKVIDAVVETLQIREHFDHIYSAQYEEHAKPHPGVFLSVAKHFKVRPRDCLVFEDAPNGVLAAKAARMVCVAVPEPENRDNKFVRTADAVLGSLEEFDAKLLERLGRAPQ